MKIECNEATDKSAIETIKISGVATARLIYTTYFPANRLYNIKPRIEQWKTHRQKWQAIPSEIQWLLLGI